MSRKWDESKHPRDPGGEDGGQFIRKGADWAATVSARIGGAHEFARGSDIVDSADWPAMYKPHLKNNAINFRGVLREIYTAQGYHAKPHVVSKEEMDRLVASGYQEMWRRVGGASIPDPNPGPDDTKYKYLNPQQVAELFRSGKDHWVGEGLFGNGTYAASRREAAYDYGDAELRIALHPDARVYEIQFNQSGGHNREGLPEIDWENEPPEKAHALVDLSNHIAALGYDAIKITDTKGRMRAVGAGDFWIILNRGAVAVEERKRG